MELSSRGEYPAVASVECVVTTKNSRWQKRWARWLDRRIPTARSVTLDQRRIFIFPSRAGLGYFLTLALMLIGAINYQNNMAFALVFFLFALFIVAILHTFANLSGLQFDALRGNPTFAGGVAEFEIQLRRTPRRRHHSIQLNWPGQPVTEISLVDSELQIAKLFHATRQRGLLKPGRLLVQTVYPLGLLRAWTWIDLDLSALVYPRPLACARPVGAGEGQPDGQHQHQLGSDDFYGFRPYRSGDNPRHVLWRARAKGLPLQTKQFSEAQMQTEWLDWAALTGERELRLSNLCYWVLELHRLNTFFGLRLPGAILPLGNGDEQRTRALQQLALFELGDSTGGKSMRSGSRG
jgi:uncharacterized protein (DUF58 family)